MGTRIVRMHRRWNMFYFFLFSLSFFQHRLTLACDCMKNRPVIQNEIVYRLQEYDERCDIRVKWSQNWLLQIKTEKSLKKNEWKNNEKCRRMAFVVDLILNYGKTIWKWIILFYGENDLSVIRTTEFTRSLWELFMMFNPNEKKNISR